MSDIRELSDSNRFSELEEAIGLKFKDYSLLKLALTHSSYANERKINKIACNERLEFLGDAILELISSDYLYKKYPDMQEGNLSKLRASLVCEEALSLSASKIKLGDYIYLGKGEDSTGGRLRASITSDAFEAVIGAIYLDSGYEKAKEFVLKYVLYDTDSFVNMADSKSVLQEKIQSSKKNCQIVYTVVEESGPEHNKSFTVSVSIDGKEFGRGSGRSKKAAEKEAARVALSNLG